MQKDAAGVEQSLGAKEYFEQYWRYCAAVRNWLVGFGVGSCILLVSEKSGIFKDVSHEKKGNILIWLMIGIVVQIVLALVNKYIHWCVYWGMESKEFRKSIWYRAANRVSRWFLIDVCADVFSIVAFIIAGRMMLAGLLRTG